MFTPVEAPGSATAAVPRLSVPFADLHGQYADLREEMLEVLAEVTASTSYVLGPKVAAFEQTFAEYAGGKHCIGVNSGTSALHLALLAAGVGPGDEVITVPMTFVATVSAILYAGARPVFVDIDPVTWTMDPSKLSAAITDRTKAILPGHLHVQVSDM